MASPDRFLLAAVMGWPISQSRSPMLHNFWFVQHGLAGSYVPLAIPPERLEAALRALPALNFSGCNLTIPLKQDAMRIVDEVDITAKRIGAISCVVVRKDGSLSGSNNDWYGFTHNVLDFVPAWRADAGPVAVMGAGGGARAVVYGLMERGAKEIRSPRGCLRSEDGVDGPFEAAIPLDLMRSSGGVFEKVDDGCPSKLRPCASRRRTCWRRVRPRIGGRLSASRL